MLPDRRRGGRGGKEDTVFESWDAPRVFCTLTPLGHVTGEEVKTDETHDGTKAVGYSRIGIQYWVRWDH